MLDVSNFVLIPTGADCRCFDIAGVDMFVSSTKAVLLVRPGLGCVAC